MAEKSPFTELGQIGVVVRDLEQAIQYYSSLGVGPFKVLDWSWSSTEAEVRGKPASFKLKFGFARLGPLQFELIQVLEGKTIYHEFLDQKGEGLHHLGFYIPDLEQAVAQCQQQGIGVLQRGKMPGGGFAYMDTEKVGGVILELIQRAPRPAARQ